MKLHTLHEDRVRALILLEVDDLMTRLKKRAMARAKPILQQMTKQAQTKKFGYGGDTEPGPGKAQDDVDVKKTNQQYANDIVSRLRDARSRYHDANVALYRDIKSRGGDKQAVKPDQGLVQNLWKAFNWVTVKDGQMTFLQKIHWLDKSIGENTHYNFKRIRNVLVQALKSGISLDDYKELESAQTSLLSGLKELLIRWGVNEGLIVGIATIVVECLCATYGIDEARIRLQSSNSGM